MSVPLFGISKSVAQDSISDFDSVDAVSSPIPHLNLPLFRSRAIQFHGTLSSRQGFKPLTVGPMASVSSSPGVIVPPIVCPGFLGIFFRYAHIFPSLVLFEQPQKRRSKRYAILAVSDALTDCVVNVSDAQLKDLGLTKGASFPINDEIKQKINILLDMLPVCLFAVLATFCFLILFLFTASFFSFSEHQTSRWFPHEHHLHLLQPWPALCVCWLCWERR